MNGEYRTVWSCQRCPSVIYRTDDDQRGDFDRIPDGTWDLDYNVRVDIGGFELGFGERSAV